MPCIQTTTSVSVSPEQRKTLEARFGKAIEVFPGKTERWLMTTLQDNVPVAMAGDGDTPAAFVEVSLLGTSDRAHFTRMPSEICDILQDVLSLDPSRVYVKYSEVTHWGWNGGNF